RSLMARVVDANLVIKWYVEEPDSDAARVLFWETEAFAVPDLLFLETASTLSKKVRKGELTREEALRISKLIVDGPFDSYSGREFERDAVGARRHRAAEVLAVFLQALEEVMEVVGQAQHGAAQLVLHALECLEVVAAQRGEERLDLGDPLPHFVEVLVVNIDEV